jgi:glycine oxidase
MSKVDKAEVVIIGGGVIGLSIARALALRGVPDICLLEKGNLGTESSFAAAGMLAPQVEADSDDEFFRLACDSRDLYKSFAASLLEETEIDVELDTTGTLYLAFSEIDEQECEHRYNWQSRAGFQVDRLTADDVRQLEPCINPAVRSALLFPNDVQVENRRLLCALVQSVESHGVRIVTGAHVDELLVEQNRVVGVKTAGGIVSCSRIVVAAGCWTSRIRVVRKNTNTLEARLPQIEPVRGQMVCLEARPQLSRHVIYSPRGYIVPRRDGRLLAGSTSEHVGFAKHPTAGGINSILSHAMQISPAIATLPVSDSWAGLRPKAADGLPVLGPCGEIEGLFYATGHYRNGILLAPITGELIARAMVKGDNSPALASFSPNRFNLTAVGA